MGVRGLLVAAALGGPALAAAGTGGSPEFRSCSGLTVAPAQDLPACPARPNCVAGRAQGAPTPTRQALAESLGRAILAEPRSQIELAAGDLVVASFRSWLFGFVDEAYFRLHDDGSFEFRSAACSGYYDFGVNRRRITRITGKLGFLPDFRGEAR